MRLQPRATRGKQGKAQSFYSLHGNLSKLKIIIKSAVRAIPAWFNAKLKHRELMRTLDNKRWTSVRQQVWRKINKITNLLQNSKSLTLQNCVHNCCCFSFEPRWYSHIPTVLFLHCRRPHVYTPLFNVLFSPSSYWKNFDFVFAVHIWHRGTPRFVPHCNCVKVFQRSALFVFGDKLR